MEEMIAFRIESHLHLGVALQELAFHRGYKWWSNSDLVNLQEKQAKYIIFDKYSKKLSFLRNDNCPHRYKICDSLSELLDVL